MPQIKGNKHIVLTTYFNKLSVRFLVAGAPGTQARFRH